VPLLPASFLADEMKKVFLFLALVALSVGAFAQKKTPFPFKGGKEHMMSFFKDSLVISQALIDNKAYGIVVFKFTADAPGRISKMVVYYADDPILIQPVIDVIKKSNKRWTIPQGELSNDYLITFSFAFNPPAAPSADLQAAVYDYNINRRPISLGNESLLDNGILLPTIVINYDIPQ
jgi:hypothetical protein